MKVIEIKGARKRNFRIERKMKDTLKLDNLCFAILENIIIH